MQIRFRFAILLAALLCSVTVLTAAAAGSALFAVAAEAPEGAAAVSTVAARAPYLLFFDEQGVLLEAMANPHQQAGNNAGALLAGLLAAKGIKTFIAGEFGGKMVGALQGAGIKHQLAAGAAADAVKAALSR